MKYKIALTLMTMVLVSMLSFSNRCGQTCDGSSYLSAQAPTVSQVAGACEVNEANDDDEAGKSPFLRMAITL
jgi:hypothetical protein